MLTSATAGPISPFLAPVPPRHLITADGPGPALSTSWAHPRDFLETAFNEAAATSSKCNPVVRALPQTAREGRTQRGSGAWGLVAVVAGVFCPHRWNKAVTNATAWPREQERAPAPAAGLSSAPFSQERTADPTSLEEIKTRLEQSRLRPPLHEPLRRHVCAIPVPKVRASLLPKQSFGHFALPGALAAPCSGSWQSDSEMLRVRGESLATKAKERSPQPGCGSRVSLAASQGDLCREARVDPRVLRGHHVPSP